METKTPKLILEHASDKARQEIRDIYGESVDLNDEKTAAARYKELGARMSASCNLLESKLLGKPEARRIGLTIQEAVHAADFKVLFPRVVEGLLQGPIEPEFIGQSVLSKTINVDGDTLFTFPAFGAIRAKDLGDTEEPPEQDPSYAAMMTEIRTKRRDVKIEVTNTVVEKSQWDVLGAYINQAKLAMNRHKEKKIFDQFDSKSVVLFDNSSADATLHTTGKDTDGLTDNATMSHMDLLDMMAALGANAYNPTDVILNPLAWVVWAKDPFLRFQLLNSNTVGNHIGGFNGSGKEINANTFVPFGLNVLVTPFQKLELGKTLTTGITGTGNYVNISVVERNRCILVAQDKPLQLLKYVNDLRDIQGMAFFERYGLALLDGGRCSVVAKNVKLDINHEPLYTIKTV